MPVDIVDAEQLTGPPTGPASTRTVQVRAAAGREYVAGRGTSWYQAIPQSLPFAVDDITTDLGDDLYEKMLLDAQVRSTVNVLKASVLENGIHLMPAIEDEEEDGYQQAVDLLERVEAMFDDLDMDAVLWDMLDALALGNRVAEQTYELDGKYVLTHLTPKPRNAVAFVVDAYLNILGILGRVPGESFPVQQGLWIPDLESIPNLLPRSKFAVLSFRPVNNDPRGTSVLRAAYNPWNFKQQLHREWLKYLSQFATPSLIGFSSELSDSYPDPSGLLDAGGNPIMRTPEQDLGEMLANVQNGSWGAAPAGSKVQIIEMSGNGEAFLRAYDFLDRQITKAVLHQTLATEEGEHQTRAATGTHKDILDTITRQAKRPVERMIEHDILRTWCRLNGEERNIELLPRVAFGVLENEDVAAMRNSIASLQTAGYLDKSQYPGLDEELHLPKRDPASLEDPEPAPVPVPSAPVQDPGAQPAPGQQQAPPESQPAEPVGISAVSAVAIAMMTT